MITGRTEAKEFGYVGAEFGPGREFLRIKAELCKERADQYDQDKEIVGVRLGQQVRGRQRARLSCPYR